MAYRFLQKCHPPSSMVHPPLIEQKTAGRCTRRRPARSPSTIYHPPSTLSPKRQTPGANRPPPRLAPALLLLLALFLAAPGCSATASEDDTPDADASLLNLSHLDHLGQDVEVGGVTYRIVHIYAEAPDYDWVGDDDEGIACVDDAARAAVVYLRHYETTGDEASRRKAEALLRFVMYMQTEDGRFYNFVWDDDLTINETHPNSRADDFAWWAARGVWALGTGAQVLKTANPAFAEACARRVRRTYPHLQALLERYGETAVHADRTVPLWLMHRYAADATSELLLGLVALDEAYPDPELRATIDRFADGIARMQYGSMNAFPYGAHASWLDAWHTWGNSQTQALAQAGRLESAVREAEHFYPRLLVDGWMHAMNLDDPADVQIFEQIAYDVRTVAVGLVRLFEATGDARYAAMAGLAASWFTGNNAAGVPMYAPEHGYGYDGILGPDRINDNAGAESTIEASYTILEVERHPEARRWLHARGDAPVRVDRDGKQYAYRIFTAGRGTDERRIAVVMNLTDERLELLEGDRLEAFTQ